MLPRSAVDEGTAPDAILRRRVRGAGVCCSMARDRAVRLVWRESAAEHRRHHLRCVRRARAAAHAQRSKVCLPRGDHRAAPTTRRNATTRRLSPDCGRAVLSAPIMRSPVSPSGRSHGRRTTSSGRSTGRITSISVLSPTDGSPGIKRVEVVPFADWERQGDHRPLVVDVDLTANSSG